jgi:acetyl esterase/lipase
VVVFGGSEGGNFMIDAAGLLAAHGYPTLSLAYFGEPGLPKELVNVPLEYFARAVRVLRRQPGVDPDHIAVMGDSRGGEAALLVASTFPHLIHGAIGLVPSATVYIPPRRRNWTRGRSTASPSRAGRSRSSGSPARS